MPKRKLIPREDAIAKRSVLQNSIDDIVKLSQSKGEKVILQYFNSSNTLAERQQYHALFLNHIPVLCRFMVVQLILKFGLSVRGYIQSIDELGQLAEISEAIDVARSVHTSSKHDFQVFKTMSDSTIRALLMKYPMWIMSMTKSVIGLQALEAHHGYLIRVMVTHYQAHPLDRKLQKQLFKQLALSPLGVRLLSLVEGLIDLLDAKHINHKLTNNQMAAMIIHDSDDGEQCFAASDDALLQHIRVTTLMAPYPISPGLLVPWMTYLLTHYEGMALLCARDFYLLRQLSDDVFMALIGKISLLPVEEATLIFSQPMIRVLFAWFGPARQTLGLPTEAVDHPIKTYLNTPSTTGVFEGQTILQWLCHSHLGIQLLAKYFVADAILDEVSVNKLFVYGDHGKRLLKKIALNGKQSSSILNRLGFFAVDDECHQRETEDQGLCDPQLN